jgi:hypothetical protein
MTKEEKREAWRQTKLKLNQARRHEGIRRWSGPQFIGWAQNPRDLHYVTNWFFEMEALYGEDNG